MEPREKPPGAFSIVAFCYQSDPQTAWPSMWNIGCGGDVFCVVDSLIPQLQKVLGTWSADPVKWWDIKFHQLHVQVGSLSQLPMEDAIPRWLESLFGGCQCLFGFASRTCQVPWPFDEMIGFFRFGGWERKCIFQDSRILNYFFLSIWWYVGINDADHFR